MTIPSRLRKPLLLLLILSVLAVAANVAMAWRTTRLKQRLGQERLALVAAEIRANNAAQENAMLQNHRRSYQDLLKRKIIAAENRLAWVEYFQQGVLKGMPAGLTYTINPQRDYEPAQGRAMGDLQMRASQLHLEAQLLHEGDLLAFLGGMEKLPGAHLLQGCDLRLASGEMNGAPYRMIASCDLELISIGARQEAMAGESKK